MAPPATSTTTPLQPLQVLRADAATRHDEVIREAVPSTPEPPGAGFAERVDELVRLARVTTEAVRAERFEDADRSDALARERFEALMAAFADAGERALDLVASVPATSTTEGDTALRIVLQLILQTTLAARHHLAEAADEHAQIDSLTNSLLAVMQAGAETAVLGTALLADQPYLHLPHEPAVLDLVELAGRGEFPRRLATTLLITLWSNAEAAGERSSADLMSMAMLLMADADPSKRTAACRRLLLDDRYRAVVLGWLREQDDVAVTAEVTVIAARELPPAAAMRTLRELSSVLPNMPSAYMVLATRAEKVVIDEYYELLAADTNPDVRRDLITGLGLARTGAAREVIELALQDPASEVRAQAMLTLSGTAPETAEAVCHRLLDDPRTANDRGVLAIAVMALQNLAAAGLVNEVDRLGQRLKQAPLPASSRHRLNEILARALPGGRTSR